jgi:tyrosyl-tRNA synthetase
MYGQIMSVPDRLTEPYLRLLTEWTDNEIQVVARRLAEGTAHPMAVKRILAGEVVAALHGVQAADAARAEFTARFSKRSFDETRGLPVVSLEEHAEDTIGALVSRMLEFAPSISAVRRVAQQNGLRLIRERDGKQQATPLAESAVQQRLGEIVAGAGAGTAEGGSLYLKVGRRVARIET